MIRITSKQEGFRRAGMAHTKAPRLYPDGRFTPAELAALAAEPLLVVEILANDRQETAAPGKKPGRGRK